MTWQFKLPEIPSNRRSKTCTTLSSASISSSNELAEQFTAHFISQCKKVKTAEDLLLIRQQPDESLRDYIDRFNKESVLVPGLSQDLAMSAFKAGIKSGSFHMELSMRPPASMPE